MTTDASVVGLVLHFRTPDLTLRCLQSLVDEGVRQVVLVDNSEDGGYSIGSLEPFLHQLKEKGTSVNTLHPSRNLGFSEGIEFGLSFIADHCPQHVLMINSDAKMESGGLRAMTECLGTSACVSLPSRRLADGRTTSSIAFYQKLMALYLRRPLFGTLAYPSGCCLLLRKDVAFSNLFDRDFFFYGDDVMLGFELSRRGVAFMECTESAVSHAVSASARNGSLFYEYHMVRAHWLLARKLARSRWEAAGFLLARCITLPLRACLRSVRSRSPAPLLGLLAATVDVAIGRRQSLTPAASASESVARFPAEG